MSKLDYNLLETLAVVVRTGSFEGAAVELGITQSAVSQRIKLLESRNGAVLIVRGRPCVATDVGIQFCRHVNQVLLLEHDFIQTIQTGQSRGANGPPTIRIAVNADSIATWFPEVIARANREYDILLDIIPDDQDHTLERLRNGDAMAAVTAEVEPPHGFRKSLLGKLGYIAVASRDFYETHFSDGVSEETVSKAPCLTFDRKDMLLTKWASMAFDGKVNLLTHWMPSFTGYLQCCLKGAGWGLVPQLSAANFLVDGTLLELCPSVHIDVPLYWQSSTNSGQTMLALSQIVQESARVHLANKKRAS